jgi:ABC-type transport system involved in multi-copper enzyme maturation permease subunit
VSATASRVLGRLANPLASKELLARMRGPRTFVIATLELLPLAALAFALYASIAGMRNGPMAGEPAGKLFFSVVTALELGLICLLAPALTADLIAGERERRTLDLLLVTPLSRRQIVVGKLVAALGALLLLIVLALPIQAVAVLLGGVGVEELLVGLVILVLTAVTYGCIGLYWSARLRTTRAAVLLAYATTLLGIGALPFGLLLFVLMGGMIGNRPDVWLWPATWLLNGPTSSSIPFARAGAVVESGGGWLQLDAILGQLLSATNPLLTGIASAAGLTQGRPIVGMETVGTVDLLYVAPWLTFAVVHLLAIVTLIWLTGRALRRDTAS